jgi:hypothetical protein
MKKNYFVPATKVVNVNVKAICEPSISVSDNAGEPTGEAPLF